MVLGALVALEKRANRQSPSPPEEIRNISVGISEYPASNEQILRNFDFILPKFHFILPKFYFAPPWRIFISS